MAANSMQVVCVLSLTGSNSKDQKGSGAADIEVRKKAYEELKKVCGCLKTELTHIQFEKLDFGETEVLDRFYNADVAVVDLSVPVQQSALFYHIGVRESMGMPETVILLHDTDPEFTLSVKVGRQ